MRRDQRGVAMPSPAIALSVVVIALAVVAYFVTGSGGGDDQATPAAQSSASASATPSAPASKPAAPKKKHKPKPKVDRATTYVVVFNNTSISGLAGQVADKASTIGWNVVGADDWRGAVPANTVYYPPQLKAAGQQLAHDLGIQRVHPADQGSMSLDRLTVIMTSPLG